RRSLRKLLAEEGYGADHLCQPLAKRGAEAVIPSTTSRRAPIPYDVLAYKDRNRVERCGAGSGASAASPPATTSSPETISPAAYCSVESGVGPMPPPALSAPGSSASRAGSAMRATRRFDHRSSASR